ncbi:MAG: hypothetical protein M1511_18720, partial [Deltaproteobacteria bacterium]|nr:hypothetical protein [Deltaproteobacteria bacterium]
MTIIVEGTPCLAFEQSLPSFSDFLFSQLPAISLGIDGSWKNLAVCERLNILTGAKLIIFGLKHVQSSTYWDHQLSISLRQEEIWDIRTPFTFTSNGTSFLVSAGCPFISRSGVSILHKNNLWQPNLYRNCLKQH